MENEEAGKKSVQVHRAAQRRWRAKVESEEGARRACRWIRQHSPASGSAIIWSDDSNKSGSYRVLALTG